MTEKTHAQRYQQLQSAPCPYCGGKIEEHTDSQTDYSSAGSGHMDDVTDTIRTVTTARLTCQGCGAVLAAKQMTTEVVQSYYSLQQEVTESEWEYTFPAG